MRQGEIINLGWKDVDLERKLITVTSSGRFLTKTGKSRTIPMSETFLYLLVQRQISAFTSTYIFHKRRFKFNQSYVEHHNTTYYWKIIANDDRGRSTTGPVWRFTNWWAIWIALPRHLLGRVFRKNLQHGADRESMLVERKP
jgi:integrase